MDYKLIFSLFITAWAMCGFIMFIIGNIEIFFYARKEASQPKKEVEYETVHDGSNWLAGLFAALMLGPVGLVLWVLEKVQNVKEKKKE